MRSCFHVIVDRLKITEFTLDDQTKVVFSLFSFLFYLKSIPQRLSTCLSNDELISVLEYLKPLTRNASIRKIVCSNNESEIIDIFSKFLGERHVPKVEIGSVKSIEGISQKVDLFV